MSEQSLTHPKVCRWKDISWGARPAHQCTNGCFFLETVNIQNSLCPAHSCSWLTDQVTGWTLDLHCFQSCLWPCFLLFLTEWTPDMTHFLIMFGSADETCHCNQTGPAQILQDYALVRVVTALPLLRSLSAPGSSALCTSPALAATWQSMLSRIHHPDYF